MVLSKSENITLLEIHWHLLLTREILKDATIGMHGHFAFYAEICQNDSKRLFSARREPPFMVSKRQWISYNVIFSFFDKTIYLQSYSLILLISSDWWPCRIMKWYGRLNYSQKLEKLKKKLIKNFPIYSAYAVSPKHSALRTFNCERTLLHLGWFPVDI